MSKFDVSLETTIKYRTRAIITRSRFETALDYKPRILSLKKVSLKYKPLCIINRGLRLYYNETFVSLLIFQFLIVLQTTKVFFLSDQFAKKKLTRIWSLAIFGWQQNLQTKYYHLHNAAYWLTRSLRFIFECWAVFLFFFQERLRVYVIICSGTWASWEFVSTDSFTIKNCIYNLFSRMSRQTC